ncbi:uncharacterized protein N0V89_011976 [Didymosphaeria variabile]|uniref:DUF726-domain-containing protein n=1 Tax=Didymosphaeria variabile TaxID=1932322 RepID=A0A9W9C584_9PLEO|nr:uncharacterized protein N0V89_011976 [Didymosphaeria variabile]KAJ4345841.1 hypothetical protein N0V89_011976 [Didymosphaeria variabile]
MPSVNAEDTPTPDDKQQPDSAPHTNSPKAEPKPEVEYDDFGLPIKKPRAPPLPESEEDERDQKKEEFKDAASEPTSTEQPAQHEKEALKPAPAEENLEELKTKTKPDVAGNNGHVEAGPPKAEATQNGEQASSAHARTLSTKSAADKRSSIVQAHNPAGISEYSHMQAAPRASEEVKEDDGEWQTMPAYARYDMYDDDNRLIARENAEELEDMHGYGNVGGAAKGYTRVIMDDDVESVTSMDDNTAYLFKERSTMLDDEDEAARDPLAQMQTTKSLLTEGQRIAYVGLVRLAIVDTAKRFTKLERNRNTKKILDMAQETTQMWSQKMMVRLYSHMEVNESEQMMIEQLSQHGVVSADLTPALMQNARVKNPAAESSDSAKDADSARPSISSPPLGSASEKGKSNSSLDLEDDDYMNSPPPPPYANHSGDDLPAVRTPSQLPTTSSLDIDLRWTILCDLFLVLIADSVYDARSRHLLETVGEYLSVDWLEICRFEKRVTEALEMEEEANKENWNEDEHMESRRKKARNRRLALMGLATVGGSLVIGLSAGLLAPLLGAGLAAGFTTIGVAGTGGFLAGAGGAAIVTTTGVVTGGTIGVRAANRRTGAVKTFEYRPLHNNKRVNLIVTVAGWMNGKLDDVRLPFSTVDPIMGDIYSVHWEPEMLRSMGDTINILATEALTQGLQQVLGATILGALMSALTLPLALTKLSYLIDNPWAVSQARADMAGLILADSLIDRNLGARPITLVGFSLGARVIFACLKELANRGAVGLVQNAYMFGTPVVAKKEEYTKVRAIVPGRCVNGYANNDWILGYLFRATSGGIMQVAGLAKVDVPGVENFDVTEFVHGHMAYRAAMPRLLREVGWQVESDEFSEIEDPDPENHEKRQRELISEIEEARKEMGKKEEKKGGFNFWRKKKVQKKDWEVYDEKSQNAIVKEQDPAKLAENPIMFDIDAIRAEVAALSYDAMYDIEGLEIKEIKSTLPPMKIDMSQTSPNPYSALRETKSYNDSLAVASQNPAGSSSNLSTYSGASTPYQNGDRKKSLEEYDEAADGGISMTFETSFKESPASRSPARSPLPSVYESPQPPSSAWDTPSRKESPVERPPLRSSTTDPSTQGAHLAPAYNAWADEFDDDFGKEKELKMTFM